MAVCLGFSIAFGVVFGRLLPQLSLFGVFGAALLFAMIVTAWLQPVVFGERRERSRPRRQWNEDDLP